MAPGGGRAGGSGIYAGGQAGGESPAGMAGQATMASAMNFRFSIFDFRFELQLHRPFIVRREAETIATSWLPSFKSAVTYFAGIKPDSIIISNQKQLSSASSSTFPSLYNNYAGDRAPHDARWFAP